jgi:hypothetical protein
MLRDFKISFYMNSHADNMFGKWKRVGYFITMGVIVRRDDDRGTTVKENGGGGWSSDGVVLWLGRRQNEDTIEWWGEWLKLRWPFNSSGGWEADGPERVIGGDGADSMLRFQLKRGGDRKKCCRKMKRRQRAHFDSMGKKYDMAWRRRPEERRHRGGEREEMLVGLTRIYWAKKWKKHMVNSAATNGW